MSDLPREIKRLETWKKGALELLESQGAKVVDLSHDLRKTERELRHYQECVLAAADAHVGEDTDEAYHQLYRAVEPTFTLPGDPFERLRDQLAPKEEPDATQQT